MITLRELKHFRFPLYIFLINELIWLSGVYFNNIHGINSFFNVMMLIPILNGSVFTMWFARRYFKGKLLKAWWSLASWQQILVNAHLRKRFVVLLVYRLLLDIMTIWILINISNFVLTIMIILAYTSINILVLLESQTLLTRNYYILEYSRTIWLFLNILTYINVVLSIYFIHLWSMHFYILWSWAVMASVLTFVLYVITLENNLKVTFFKTSLFLLGNIIFWYWGLKYYFILNVPSWLFPVVTYGLLILVMDVIYHHHNKRARLLEIISIFGLSIIILLL